ncbi:AMP-binding protein [Singulisphaera acidiphila]|uniref:Acyl-CoA synthetase (AMP-forming)/AMP-acid ligase II n=1 Tax=Singulisphaera acidiphila (strain ATCC BAA-1392 / DSM 18658 / VKM B-2454 / MOB10) TaxID=886293 RepID=L0DJL2_SINAD|nr:AMP-binding protein [Singulisphaera acidiphila]AGA29574.1 acyl-CoA synthetase (AMP-forming)/AMP-acid ligase II [Singulisphaera acidiphila DSM 18658]
MSQETATRPAGTAQPALEIPLPPLPPDWRSLARAFVHQARVRWGQLAVSDSTGASLTYGKTFIRALALGRVLARRLGPHPYVGLLIPPTVPASVANLTLTLWGRIPVNLNYSASESLINSSIDQCGITHVVTSEKVLDKFKLRPKGELVLLEDIPKQVTLADKLWAAAVAKLVPISQLDRFLPGLRAENLDNTATVIFTSGSTGNPKGVVLSQRNVLTNIHQINTQLNILPDESLLGILPFFHSFGFTVGLWTVFCLGKKIVYHFNPLDAKTIGKLCETHRVTLLAGTPTFMRSYLQRCDPKQFATVVHLLLGAEKLKPELARELRETLKIEPMEGYGCTELSPVVSFNVPHDKVLADGRTVPGTREGTVGLPVPGTSIKTIDPETGADLPRGTAGMILVAGPQVMVGYLNQPEATAKVLKNGWYQTGDIGYVDEDGFLRITDRLSRFSKIGGEMVPHMAVETAIQEATGTNEQNVAITSLPDLKRGERLCVIHTPLGITPQEVNRRLTAGSMPRLWIPAADDFIEVESIPILGSGKVDLRQLREIAQQRVPKS